METAVEVGYRQDLRAMRVQPLMYALVEAMKPYLLDDDRAPERVYYALTELLRREGAELITDRVRADIGLPPRGSDGWTDDEIRALEAARLAAIIKPMSFVVNKEAPIAMSEIQDATNFNPIIKA